MAASDTTPGKDNASLLRAKRVFLVNSALCVCLLFIAAFMFLGGEEDTESDLAPPVPEREWSLPELAYLKGEMQALREHPNTMPQYEEEWVRKHAEQAIRRDREFDGAGEALTPILVNEYLRAYTERFEDYYDGHAAREFGYRYGVKFNPDLHGSFPRECYGTLNANRQKLEQAFEIPDEATWRLFCDAFDKGFVQGYRIVEDGVTAQSHWDKITLFED